MDTFCDFIGLADLFHCTTAVFLLTVISFLNHGHSPWFSAHIKKRTLSSAVNAFGNRLSAYPVILSQPPYASGLPLPASRPSGRVHRASRFHPLLILFPLDCFFNFSETLYIFFIFERNQGIQCINNRFLCNTGA